MMTPRERRSNFYFLRGVVIRESDDEKGRFNVFSVTKEETFYR